MIANLFDKNMARVLALFLISPGSKYIRKEIKEKTGLNNVPLDKALNKLLSLRIIKQERNLLSLNQDYEFKDLIEKLRKEFVELNLPLKIYYIVLEISNKLSEIAAVKQVYLFGSYAKLIYHEKSDIDLAVIFDNKVKNKAGIEKRINSIIGKIGRKHNKEVEIHFFLEKDMKVKDPLVKDISRNGKKIV